MKEIYETMNALARKAKTMNNISKDEKLPFDKARSIKKEQDKIYKKWKFFDEYIKEFNK